MLWWLIKFPNNNTWCNPWCHVSIPFKVGHFCDTQIKVLLQNSTLPIHSYWAASIQRKHSNCSWFVKQGRKEGVSYDMFKSNWQSHTMVIRSSRWMCYLCLYEAVKCFTKDNDDDSTSKHYLHNRTTELCMTLSANHPHSSVLYLSNTTWIVTLL